MKQDYDERYSERDVKALEALSNSDRTSDEDLEEVAKLLEEDNYQAAKNFVGNIVVREATEDFDGIWMSGSVYKDKKELNVIFSHYDDIQESLEYISKEKKENGDQGILGIANESNEYLFKRGVLTLGGGIVGTAGVDVISNTFQTVGELTAENPQPAAVAGFFGGMYATHKILDAYESYKSDSDIRDIKYKIDP